MLELFPDLRRSRRAALGSPIVGRVSWPYHRSPRKRPHRGWCGALRATGKSGRSRPGLPASWIPCPIGLIRAGLGLNCNQSGCAPVAAAADLSGFGKKSYAHCRGLCGIATKTHDNLRASCFLGRVGGPGGVSGFVPTVGPDGVRWRRERVRRFSGRQWEQKTGPDVYRYTGLKAALRAALRVPVPLRPCLGTVGIR